MRCPECTQRNSIAANSCKYCGQTFSKKPQPITVKVAVAITLTLATAWGVGAAVLPALNAPDQSLSRIAKRAIAGPSSPEDAQRIRNDLDIGVRKFLTEFGTLPTADLASRLQRALSSSAFEVHAFDLPRGLRVVEVDTILQARDYVIVRDQNQARVFPIQGFEVFDSARIINESAPTLVLIGHTSGQSTRRPLIRTFSILPNKIVDTTAKLLPETKGEGNAIFARNSKDIILDLSVRSIAVADKVLKPLAPQQLQTAEDETVKFILSWKDGHYSFIPRLGNSSFSAACALATAIKNTNHSGTSEPLFNGKALRFITRAKSLSQSPGDYTIDRLKPQTGSQNDLISYCLNNGRDAFALDFKRNGDVWEFLGGRFMKPSEIKLSDIAQNIGNSVTPATSTPSSPPGRQIGSSDENKQPAKIVVRHVDSNNRDQSGKQRTAQDDFAIDGNHNAARLALSAPHAERKSNVNGSPATASNVLSVVKDLSKTPSANQLMNQLKIRSTPQQPSTSMPETMREPKELHSSRSHSKQNEANESASAGILESKKGIADPKADSSTRTVLLENTNRSKSKAERKQDTTASGTTEVGSSRSSLSPPPTRTAGSEGVEATISQMAGNSAKVRSGPSTNYRQLVELPKGTKVQVMGKQNGWYQVRAGGKEGFIYGGLVDYKKDDGYRTATVTKTDIITDAGHKVVSTPKSGDKIVILGGVNDGKYKVQLSNGKTGFVQKDAVNVMIDEPQLVP